MKIILPATNPERPIRTRWHRLLGKLLELLLTRFGITVQTEVPITSEPPKADILLLRRNSEPWTEEQRQLLCDGLRDTQAIYLLIEFKFSESLNADALLQALSYAYFYRQSQKLAEEDIQTFVMVSRTPQAKVLEYFGFVQSDRPGIYRSSFPLLNLIEVIVLNQLQPQTHNAFVQTFASKRRIRRQAFAQLDLLNRGTIDENLLELLMGLRSQFELQEVDMSKLKFQEELTPELLMQLGRKVRSSVVANLTLEERMAGLAPEERMAGLAPEDRLAGLAPEELEQLVVKVPVEKRLLGLGLSTEELSSLMAQIEEFLQQQGKK